MVDLIARFHLPKRAFHGTIARKRNAAKITKCTQALQHRGAARAQGDHPNEKSNCEQYLFFQIEPEFKRLYERE